MVRKAIFAVLSAFALFCMVTNAYADQVTLQLDYPNNYIISGVISTNNGSVNGVLVCLDWSRSATYQPYLANVNTFADLSSTRFGEVNREKYLQAAWLYSQIIANPGDEQDIQYAIWGLFNSAAPKTLASEKWIRDARIKSVGFDASGFLILTPTNLSISGPQEMIVKIGLPKPNATPTPPSTPTPPPPPQAAVPEPATMLLVASGLGLAALRRRKRS